MTRRLVFALLLPLTGCIIYDIDPKGDEGPDHPRGGYDDSGLGDDDTGAVPEAAKLVLDPASAPAGETLIAHLTAEGDYDLARIAEVGFSYGVTVGAMEPGDAEILLALTIDHAAVPGPVDMAITEASGRVEYYEDVFEILEPAQDGGDDGTDAGDCG